MIPVRQDLKELVRQIYRNEVWQEPREDAHGSKRRSKRSSEKRSEQRSARSRTRERERHAAKGEENLWQVGVLQEFAVLELLYGTVLVQCSLERLISSLTCCLPIRARLSICTDSELLLRQHSTSKISRLIIGWVDLPLCVRGGRFENEKLQYYAVLLINQQPPFSFDS